MTNKKTKIWIALMKFGGRIGCHQRADRSFSFRGYQFPVCARCTGVIIGEALAVVLLFAKIRINVIYCIASILPLAIDGCLQLVNVWESNNIRRIITGIIAGTGLTYLYYYAFVFLLELLHVY